MKTTIDNLRHMLATQNATNNVMASKHGAPWVALARLNQAFLPKDAPAGAPFVLPVNYITAAARELMELIVETGTHGFPIKWWIGSEPQLAGWGGGLVNRKIEYVDMIHFGMSASLLTQVSPQDDTIQEYQIDNVATLMKNSIEYAESLPLDPDAVIADRLVSLQSAMNTMLVNLIQCRTFDWASFGRMINLDGILFDDLYEVYMGKALLNAFRQSNGDASGIYKRNWGGVADNEVMVSLLPQVTTRATEHLAGFQNELQSLLAEKYSEFAPAPQPVDTRVEGADAAPGE